MLGGDSVFGIVVKAACEGEHPSRDFEGKLITHLSGVVKNPPGGKLSNRYILLQIKADWAEMASTIGFPSWSCNANPCIMCGAHKGSMYCYDGVSLTSDPWGGKPTTYDSECSRCEIVVNVTSEYVRSCILEKGGLYSDPSKKAMGRLLSSDVAELRLFAGDRLEPTSQLRDIYAFEHAELPFSCTFWREQRDARRRILSWTHRRHPLFSESIGTSPSRTLHLDTLHTLYLGVFATFCHTVIHAMYRADVFNTELHGKAAEKANLDRFFSCYRKWCVDTGVPLSYQLGVFCPTMVPPEHLPGLKLKAAETGIMMKFCTQFCSDFSDGFPEAETLHAAGLCLVEYTQILKDEPMKVPFLSCRRLMFLCLRHLHLMQSIAAKDQPKSHLFVHVTRRVFHFGNPRGYSTFWDEGLNLTLSNMASASHRANWHNAFFLRVRLLPFVQSNSPFAMV